MSRINELTATLLPFVFVFNAEPYRDSTQFVEDFATFLKHLETAVKKDGCWWTSTFTESADDFLYPVRLVLSSNKEDYHRPLLYERISHSSIGQMKERFNLVVVPATRNSAVKIKSVVLRKFSEDYFKDYRFYKEEKSENFWK